MCREQSPRMLRMSATVASIGSPRMRKQFLVVPHVISCCGTSTVAAIGAGNCVSSDVICADVTSWPSVGDARGSKLLLSTCTSHGLNQQHGPNWDQMSINPSYQRKTARRSTLFKCRYFTRWRYPFVCLSVRVSVTIRYDTVYFTL